MTSSVTPPERWLAYREINPQARLRMFCFPYAGGGASIYRGWSNGFPGHVEVCPVQLPGREGRLRDKPFQRIGDMVPALADALQGLFDLPYVFFGHSMGALIGYELSLEQRRRGRPLPLHLFVSGRRAPQIPSDDDPIHDLPEPEFLQQLRDLNGTPEEVLQHEELMRLLLPILRADFAVNETYVYAGGEPFDLGISAFGGLGDPEVPRADLDAWRQQTRGRFRLRMLPGDHFFLHSARDLILESVSRDLAEVAAEALSGAR